MEQLSVRHISRREIQFEVQNISLKIKLDGVVLQKNLCSISFSFMRVFVIARFCYVSEILSNFRTPLFRPKVNRDLYDWKCRLGWMFQGDNIFLEFVYQVLIVFPSDFVSALLSCVQLMPHFHYSFNHAI